MRNILKKWREIYRHGRFSAYVYRHTSPYRFGLRWLIWHIGNNNGHEEVKAAYFRRYGNKIAQECARRAN